MLKFSQKKKKKLFSKNRFCVKENEETFGNFLFIQIKSLKINELFARHTCAEAAPGTKYTPRLSLRVHIDILTGSQKIQRTGIWYTTNGFSDKRESQRTG